MTYTVRYQRDDTGWWVASVPEVPGCHTQGRTIPEARRRIREALGLFVAGADRAELVDRVRMPAGMRQAVRAHCSARRRLTHAREQAQEAQAQAARVLKEDFGLSVRDIGHLLELSHQRVQQLLSG